jgi:hypothetical protein
MNAGDAAAFAISTRAVENGANSLGKNLSGHRLLHELDAGIKAPLMDDVV